MSSMNSRLKGLGFGSKRKSSANIPTSIAQNPSASAPQLPGRPTTASAASSTTSLPMNHPGPGGRPPSYTNQYSPAPAGRTQSPMAGGTPRTPPSQVMGGPPPINTAASGYPPGHPQGGMAPPPAGGPPQYGPPQYGAPQPPAGNQSVAAAQYANRNNAVEVEGAGRSKAQLIVGIDFVRILLSIMRLHLMYTGYYVLRCRFCVCDQYRSQRRYHHRMAWCRIIYQTEGMLRRFSTMVSC
jgi:hypothetical protein